MGRADLHSHSTWSDGLFSPAELIDAARRARLEVLSITDHESVGAYHGLPRESDGLTLVVGVEISAYHEGEEIHLLGYFVDPNHPDLLNLLNRMASARRDRADRIMRRLSDAGVSIPDELRRNLLTTNCVGRSHIARVLVEIKAVRDRAEAFRRYLTPGTPGYERRSDLPSAKEVIEMIDRAGGVAVWAHPGTDCMLDPGPLSQLERHGLQGLEAYHPSHTRGEGDRLATFARLRGLVPTGGSDFHGDAREGGRLGDCAVGAEVVGLLERLRRRSS